MRLLSAVLLAVLLATAAQAQTAVAYHTTLFDHADPAPPDAIRYSALTGYTAPDGREYALLSGLFNTYIYDVTDKPIRLVAAIHGTNTQWREIKTYRQLAYVVTDQAYPYDGLQIIDLSELPDTAREISRDTTYFHTAHTVTREGDYLYINGSDPKAGANGGTLIFKLSDDPLHPALVGKFTLEYVHDASVRNDTMYAASIYDGHLDIVYLGADRKNPTLVAQVRYPGGGTHNAEPTQDGSYVLTTDEINPTPKTLKIWDIRDLNNIGKVADYTPVPGQIVHNVRMKGSIAFVSWYTAGTRIIDVSDPRDPAQIGYYDTFDGASAQYFGNWEVYPYLPSGKILASDRETGLYVFTFDGVGKGKISGRVLDSVTGDPLPFARIAIPMIGDTITADSLGRYSFSGAADTLAVSIELDGYLARTDSLMPRAGGVTKDFLLEHAVSSTVAGSRRDIDDAVTVSMESSGASRVLTIHAGRPERSVHLRIFGLDGRAALTLYDGPLDAGARALSIDAGLPSGIYLWDLAVDGGAESSGRFQLIR
jgi:choice-of-anchor B domain-containing protein